MTGDILTIPPATAYWTIEKKVIHYNKMNHLRYFESIFLWEKIIEPAIFPSCIVCA